MKTRFLFLTKIRPFEKEKYIEYFTLIVCIFIMSAVLFYRYIFGNDYYIFPGTDTIRATYPGYYVVARYFEEGWSWWSFNMGIGASQLSRSTVLSDPFNYILLLNKNCISQLIVLAVILRITFSGAFFYHYLDNFNFSKYSKFLAAFVYSFSGYIIITGRDYGFATICVYLPAILNGVEKIIKNRKILSFIIPVTLTAIYYNLMFYMAVFVIAGYFFVRFLSLKYKSIKVFFELILYFIISGIASLLLSAFWLIPVGYLTGQSPRIGGSNIINLFDFNISPLFTAILRCFNIDALGNNLTDISYHGYANQYLQIATYTTLLALVMILYIFASKMKSNIVRKYILTLFILFLMVTAFNVFPYVLNGFSTITYRWSFVINFFLATCVAIGTDFVFNKQVSSFKYVIFLIFVLCAFLWCIAYQNLGHSPSMLEIKNEFYTHADLFGLTIVILLLYSLFIFLLKKGKITKKFFAFFIFATLVFEILMNYYDWLNLTNAYSKSAKYNTIEYFDDSLEFVNKIKETDQDKFYRINKEFDSLYRADGLPSDNDALVQNYYGLKYYCSLNPIGYITFLQNMGIYVKNPLEQIDENVVKPKDIKSSSLNYINGVGDRYNLMSYLGVKYLFTKNEKNQSLSDNWTLISNFKGIYCYRNEDYNPLIFATKFAVSESDFEKLSDEEKDNLLFSLSVLDDNCNIEFNSISDIEKKNLLSITSITKRNRESLRIEEFEEDCILGNIVVDSSGFLNTTIPFDKGWTIYIDDQRVDTLSLNNGLLGCAIEKGTHNFVIKYHPYGMKQGMLVSFFSLILLFLILKKFNIVDIHIKNFAELCEKKCRNIFMYICPKISLVKTLRYRFLLEIIMVILIIILLNRPLYSPSEIIFNDWNYALYQEILSDTEDINLDDITNNPPKRVVVGSTLNLPSNCDLGIQYTHVYDKNNITIEIVGRDSECLPHIWMRSYTTAGGWSEFYEVTFSCD